MKSTKTKKANSDHKIDNLLIEKESPLQG